MYCYLKCIVYDKLLKFKKVKQHDLCDRRHDPQITTTGMVTLSLGM